MRIRGSERGGSHGFWTDAKKWFYSRGGVIRFLLAAGTGFVFACALGVWYKLDGYQVVDPAIRSLFAQAEETAKTAVETNDLQTLYFDIGFEEYQAMAGQREEALQRGILLLDDDDWMGAQIRFQGETIPVRIRLKGDWLDHLGENKWSFRVKTRNDAALMGMRSFSVQSPATRRYLSEWLYLEDLRRADILAPRYSFVNVVVNGEDWGIYALEESFSKELLESQGRREGVIVRFDESLFWSRRALFGGLDDRWKFYLDPVATTYESYRFSQVDEFNTTEVQSDPVLAEQATAALGLLRGFQSHQLLPAQVFDAELMGRYLAHTNLWGARHGLTWHNERYYYNPLTSRLEPIGYDAIPLDHRTAQLIDLAQYDDLAIMEAYAREVVRVSQPEYLEELQGAYGDEFERYYGALVQEFNPANLEAPWEALAERQAILVGALHPPQTVYAYQVGDDQGPTVDVQVGNILRYPVSLRQVQIGDRAVDVQWDWVSEGDRALLHQEAEPAVVLRRVAGAVPEYVTLHVPASAVNQLLPAETPLGAAGRDTCPTATLQIATSLFGMDDQIVVDVQRDYPAPLDRPVLPVQPSVEEALARYPFLTRSEQPGFLELRAGTWQVEGDLVLPDGFGLWATESVTLTFDRQALFLSSGPLVLQGPDDGGIHLGPKDDTWAGLIVLQAGADEASTLHNVEIRATAGISRDGWITTGGVTFYESPVVLSNCQLLDSIAEDTINVVRSKFEFVRSEFGRTASDAFDGDFVRGRVEQCAFHDVRGDGIDVSGSVVTVEDVTLLRIYDKGISAGEGSVVDVENLHAADVGMAIASKDMSRVTARDVDIARAWVAGLAAYLKKMEYGPATVEASHVVFRDDSRRALAQVGSQVTIDGEDAATTELDVDELYLRLEALAAIRPLNYQFGSAIRLLDYELATPQVSPGDEVRLVLYWQADARPDRDYTVFVHVLDAAGELVAQRDNMPGDNSSPTTRWPVGPLIEDVHVVSLPPDVPVGECRVVIGMYVWQTGDRLPVYRPDGEQIPDGAVVLDRTLEVGG